MNTRTNMFLDIITEYQDKGAKAADKALSALGSTAKKVAGTIGVAFAAADIVQFGRSSVAAFTQANQAFATLSNTLGNQGFQVSINQLSDLFDKLEMKYGKDKSVLIPAFQNLLNSTGSLTKAQELLNLTMDVAQGTGRDVASVSMAIGKAYVGQTTALSKLGVGLTKADLTTKDFTKLQDKLSQKFTGSASAAASTYAGKIEKLNIALGNAQETIGKGIVDAFGNLNTNSNFNSVIEKINQMATDVSDIVRGMGQIAGQLGSVAGKVGLKPSLGSIPIVGAWLNIFRDAGRKQSQQQKDMLASLDDQVATQLANYNASKKVAAEAAKQAAAEKVITDQKKKQLELQKAKAVLDAAGKVLDVQQAEIIAAMKNATLTEDELLRLRLKQALLNDNASAAGKLAQELINSQTMMLQLQALDPMQATNKGLLDAIKNLQMLRDQLLALQIPAPAAFNPVAWGLSYTSSQGLSSNNLANGSWTQYYNGLSGGLYGSTPVNVVVSVDPNNGNINAATQNTSLNGTTTSAPRIDPISWGNLWNS